MSLALQIVLLVLVVIFLLAIIHLLRKGKLSLKYSLIWIFSSIILLIMIIFPQLSIQVSKWIGVEVPSNFIFMLEGIFVLVILISLTLIVSNQTSRLTRLTQAVAILERRIRDLEEKNAGSEQKKEQDDPNHLESH
ncbi:DUF2304 domain-containing protein [Clostridium facile]|uniref:DUF2304 domain-containing protein n=1 Tax=Clostridium facile TaxID=2763035 RepID=A0ABR7IP17_9CLOT|nr:DUF2304 domain-containing protein [Clostridium facile]MBC5786874.1 DUF2304 domain-containing protein [Clostridium facile]